MSEQLERSDKNCIAACDECAADCGHCFAHMAGEGTGVACPAGCIECAAICRLCAACRAMAG